MKKIREAYHQGTNGNEVGSNKKLRHRGAHRIGKLVGASLEAKNNRMEEDQVYALGLAILRSKNPNTLALETIRDSRGIIAPGEPNPAVGVGIVDKKAGTESRQWNVMLSTGKDRDPSRPHKIPVINLPDFFAPGGDVKVDNVALSCEASIKDGKIGGGQTTLWINTRPHDPEATEPTDFTDGFRAHIATDGRIELARTVEGGTGYEPIEPGLSVFPVRAFLDDLHGCVTTTAYEYQKIG